MSGQLFPTTASSSGFPYVQRILVKELFGRYTYDLQLRGDGAPYASKLLILYGDNGSGKTSILELLFHLIHPARGGGHRSFVAQRIFRTFSIHFSDGTTVSAERGDGLIGNFRMAIRLPNGSERSVEWLADEEGSVKGTAQGEPEEAEFLKYLAGLNVGLYFLSDNRRISTTLHYGQAAEADSEYFSLESVYKYAMEKPSSLRRTVERIGARSREAALELTVRRASSWATQQVLRASNKGDEDANAIYTNIVRHILRHQKKRQGALTASSKAKLIQDLQALEQKSLAFSRYGLIAPANTNPLIEAIKTARREAMPTITDVIRPYVDGLKARLKALQKVHDSIDAFIKLVNGFFHDKEVKFHTRQGLSISTADGAVLSAGALSSGERQLLLLVANLFVASRQNSFFIVDEPELSLNVKWQRELIRNLLDFTRESRVQFVLATHSIELLTKYKEYVVRLRPIPRD